MQIRWWLLQIPHPALGWLSTVFPQAELQGQPAPVATQIHIVCGALFTLGTEKHPAGMFFSLTKVVPAYYILEFSVPSTSALENLPQSQAGFWASSDLPQPLYWNYHVAPTRVGELSEVWPGHRLEPNSVHGA